MKTRLSSWWESLRTSYWFVPAVMAFGTAVLAEFAVYFDRQLGDELPGWIYSGGATGAWTLLSAIVGAMMSVTSVVFSITIVALTLAANQFGPRLPRNFMRDRGSQITLGVFISTFVYALLLLRTIYAEDEGFVPQVAISLAILLTLVSTGVLIFFIHHIASSIQAESVIGVVDSELRTTIDRLYPQEEDVDESTEEGASGVEDLPEDFDERSAPVSLDHGNYLQGIETGAVLELAVEKDLVIRFLHRAGDFLTEGEPIAHIWPEDHVDDDLRKQLLRKIVTGTRRTPTQDVEYGILQFVEIAVRALSPGINDPFTATACIDRLGSSLRKLAARPEPPHLSRDDDGKLRVIYESTNFFGHMDAAFNQIRQNSRGCVAVLARLLETFDLIAPETRDARRADSVLRHAEMVRDSARRQVPEEHDLHEIQERYEKVRKTVESRKEEVGKR